MCLTNTTGYMDRETQPEEVVGASLVVPRASCLVSQMALCDPFSLFDFEVPLLDFD